MAPRASERGQATVELALCLPLVALLLGLVVEVGFIVGDQARLWQAAREAARVSAVDASPARVEAAARAVGFDRLTVEIDPEESFRVSGRRTTVTLRYEPASRVPLLGRLVPRRSLRADATMRIEQP